MAEEKPTPFPYDVWAQSLAVRMQEYDRTFEHVHENPEDRFEAYLAVLSDIALSLGLLPGFRADLLPLQDLERRLLAMSEGHRGALEPPESDKRGRPAYSSLDKFQIGRSAAAVEILIQAGFAADEAAETVARALNKYRVLGRRGDGVTDATVSEWFEAVCAETAPEETLDSYRENLALFQELALKDQTKATLKRLTPTLVRPFGRPMIRKSD